MAERYDTTQHRCLSDVSGMQSHPTKQLLDAACSRIGTTHSAIA